MKRYLYKIYKPNGDFITTLKDVASKPSFTSYINGGYGEMTIVLAKTMFEFDEGVSIIQGNRVDLLCYDKDTNDWSSTQKEVKVFSGFISKYAPSLKRESEEVVVTVLGSITQLERYILEFPESESDKSLTLVRSSGQYARKTAPSNLSISGDATLEAWVNVTTLPTLNDTYITYHGKDSTAQADNSNYQMKLDNNGKLKWSHEYGSSSGTETIVATNTTIRSTDIGKWVHLAITRDTTTNKIAFYKNGILIEEKTYTYETNGGSTADLTIGASNGGSSDDYFDGKIADIRIWAEKKTEVEIGGNMYKHLVGTETNLRGYWKLDNNYTDETSNSNNLTAGGSPTFTTDVFGGETEISYYQMSPSDILKDILNKFTALGGTPFYDSTSIDDTGTTVTYSMNTLTVAEALRKCVELSPAGWYYFVDAENIVKFKDNETDADHLIVMQKDVISIQQEKSTEHMINRIYFTGGEVGGSKMYRKYSRSSSINTYGLYAMKKVDTRITLASTMDTIAGAILDRADSPEVRTLMVLKDNNAYYQGAFSVGFGSSYGMDIEKIHPGDTIKTIGFDSKLTNKWDEAIWDTDVWDYERSEVLSIVQQIRKVSYKPESIEIEISTRLPDVARSVKILEERVTKQNTNENPSTPTTA